MLLAFCFGFQNNNPKVCVYKLPVGGQFCHSTCTYTHTRFQFQSAGWGGRRRQRRGSAVVRSNIFLSRNQLTSRKALIESLRSVGTSGAKRRTDGGKKSAGMGWAAERRVSPLAWPIGNAAGLLFRGAAMVPTKIN